MSFSLLAFFEEKEIKRLIVKKQCKCLFHVICVMQIMWDTQPIIFINTSNMTLVHVIGKYFLDAHGLDKSLFEKSLICASFLPHLSVVVHYLKKIIKKSGVTSVIIIVKSIKRIKTLVTKLQ